MLDLMIAGADRHGRHEEALAAARLVLQLPLSPAARTARERAVAEREANR